MVDLETPRIALSFVVDLETSRIGAVCVFEYAGVVRLTSGGLKNSGCVSICARLAPGGGPGGRDLAFLGLAFFLLNILFFHSAMPRNAVFPESGHNFRAKRSLAFLGRSLSLSGSAFCAGKNGIRQKHDNANSFLGRSLVGFADLKPDVGWSIFLHRCKAIQLLEFLLKKSGVCLSYKLHFAQYDTGDKAVRMGCFEGLFLGRNSRHKIGFTV